MCCQSDEAIWSELPVFATTTPTDWPSVSPRLGMFVLRTTGRATPFARNSWQKRSTESISGAVVPCQPRLNFSTSTAASPTMVAPVSRCIAIFNDLHWPNARLCRWGHTRELRTPENESCGPGRFSQRAWPALSMTLPPAKPTTRPPARRTSPQRTRTAPEPVPNPWLTGTDRLGLWPGSGRPQRRGPSALRAEGR